MDSTGNSVGDLITCELDAERLGEQILKKIADAAIALSNNEETITHLEDLIFKLRALKFWSLEALNEKRAWEW